MSNLMGHDINRFKVTTFIDSAGACPGTHPCYRCKAWGGKGLRKMQSWAGKDWAQETVTIHFHQFIIVCRLTTCCAHTNHLGVDPALVGNGEDIEASEDECMVPV